MPPPLELLWLAVVASTLAGVAVGRCPWVRMNRATIAVVVASSGALSATLAWGVLWLR